MFYCFARYYLARVYKQGSVHSSFISASNSSLLLVQVIERILWINGWSVLPKIHFFTNLACLGRSGIESSIVRRILFPSIIVLLVEVLFPAQAASSRPPLVAVTETLKATCNGQAISECNH